MITIYVNQNNYCEYGGMYVPGSTTIPVEVPDNFWLIIPPYWEYDPISNSMIQYDPGVFVPDYVSIARYKKELLIDGANSYIDSRQWTARSLKGRLSAEEDALFDEWLTYVESLYAVDVSAGQNTVFPDPPDKPAQYTM